MPSLGSLKLITSDTRRKAPAPHLQLQNRFSALVGDKGLGAPSETPKLAKSEPCRSTRRKWQVIIVGKFSAVGGGDSHPLT